METKFKFGFILVTASVFFGNIALALPAPPIKVQPEFRATPVWYWKNEKLVCIPVPSYDVILNVGPKEIRKAQLPKNVKHCELRLGERQIIATLQCGEKVIEKFFTKEALCKESKQNVASHK